MNPTAKESLQAPVLPELWHALVQCAPVPMVELQGPGHIVSYVNPAFCRLVAKDKKALVGMPFAEIVQEGDRCLEVLDRVYRTTEPEIHTESEQTETHPAYWSYAIWPVLDGNQRSVGLMMQVTETTLFHQQTGAMNQELLISAVHQHELTETAEKLNDRLRTEIAERERAAEALRLTMEFDEAVMTNMGEGLYTVDDGGRVTSMNRAAEKLFGWKLEELRGKKMHDMTHYKRPDGRPFPAEECAGLHVSAQGKTLTDHEDVFIRKDGTFFHVEFSSSPLHEGDKITGLVVVFRDITERKQAAETLAQRHAEIQSHAEELSRFNTAAVGRESRMIELKKEINELCQRQGEAAHYPLEFESEKKEADGEEWLHGTDAEQSQGMAELRMMNVKVQESRRAALNLMEDAVQSRQSMEKLNGELHESEERFRSLVSVITDVTWTTDPKGQFVAPQAAWQAYTGQTWEEQRGLGWIDSLHPDDRERVKQIWNEACASRTLYQSEGRLWHAPTQHWRYFMAKAKPLLNADGSVREWVGTCIDCEDQKRAQEKLEDTVAERTVDLQRANTALLLDMEERRKLQEQFVQAQKMESIGTLAGGIAHDFNNILSIIEGYAFILNGYGSNNPDIAESLTVINKTVQRGSALVQQLLTLARKSSTKVEAININGVIDDLIGLMTQTFPKTIEFSSALEANLPPITGDKNQIEQALLNLCVNARDAMSNGGRLNFRTQSIDGATLEHLGETRDRRYVCLEVNDTGMGMDEEIQKRIFEPFFTTKDIGHGTGLGLSVVYGIVENHKGFIDVESKPRSGTSFKLYFPLALLGETPATGQIIKSSFETTERPNRYGTILVVEDEENMMKLLYKVLERHGYKILTASDGETAVETYQHSKEAIDVVVLDLGLPKMTGREVLRHIKNENPDVKVVIASGYLEPEVKSEIDRAGVKYFVPKPYSPDEVVQALQSLIEKES